MNRAMLAAIISAAVVGIAATIMLVLETNAISVVIYLVAMLTSGFINDIGWFHLGEWKNGFFLPTTAGYIVAATVDGLLLFVFLLFVLPRKWPREKASQGA